MSKEDDRAYYERRLKEERTRAASAEDPALRTLHRRWAALYAARLGRTSPHCDLLAPATPED